MNKLLLFLILSVVSFTSSFAQSTDKVTTKIIEIGNADNQAMRHLDILSNRIGGRLIGSSNYDIAVEWTASEFRKWGMEVVVEKVGELPVGFNRGAWFGKMLSEDGMNLHFVTPSYSAGTKGVQRGHVVAEPRTQQEFERMKGVLKGAWVLVGGKNNGWAIDRSAKGDSIRKAAIAENIVIGKYNDSIMREARTARKEPQGLKPYNNTPALFYNEMVEAGILGTIQSAPVPLQALYDRTVFKDMSFDNLPQIPDIKLDEQQYAVIAEKVRRRDYFQLEFDIRNHFRPGPVAYHNVIGIIRGSERPDEYVMSGGHLDAFDVATGGVDCGSGSTANMEAARLIMKAAEGKKPKRSIAICLWAGEEFGLLGSKFWVESNKDKWGKVSNYFNRDGGPTVANSLTVTPEMMPVFERVCAPLNSINPDFPFTLSVREGKPAPRPKSGSSDHAYFAMNGIPTMSFGTADPKGYDFSYSEIWHTERDLFNKSIAEYQEHSATVMAVVLWRLANEKELLPRKGLYAE